MYILVASLAVVTMRPRARWIPARSSTAEILDLACHSPSPGRVGDSPRDQKLHHDAEGVEKAADAHERHDHREDPAGSRERLHLAIPDGRDGGDGHEERVEPTPADVPP
jgi:hypothetical protein